MKPRLSLNTPLKDGSQIAILCSNPREMYNEFVKHRGRDLFCANAATRWMRLCSTGGISGNTLFFFNKELPITDSTKYDKVIWVITEEEPGKVTLPPVLQNLRNLLGEDWGNNDAFGVLYL